MVHTPERMWPIEITNWEVGSPTSDPEVCKKQIKSLIRSGELPTVLLINNSRIDFSSLFDDGEEKPLMSVGVVE